MRVIAKLFLKRKKCDLEKCMGKRTNGLYVCQFSNLPGSIYSQYLRHRRRQNAYKTKPCRNLFGNNYCPIGDDCPFYHSKEEQRMPPPDQFDLYSIMAANENNIGMQFNAAAVPFQPQSIVGEGSVDKALDALIQQVSETYQQMYKYVNQLLLVKF